MRAIRIGLQFILLLAATAFGEQHPNIERGYLPDKSYQLADVDTINLFNGAVNVAIPLGLRYPVNGNLSYQFVLSYATNGWEIGEHSVDVYSEYEPYWWTVTNHWSYPLRRMNAGFGWTLTLGHVFPPEVNSSGNGNGHWTYVSPDGGHHSFYDTLHANNDEEDPSIGTNPPQLWARYTRDGTYLRLRRYSDRYELDFPNGDVHKFDNDGRLVSITDPFGNFVSVAYSVRTGTYAGSPKWTVTDSTGRLHYVYFRPAPSYPEMEFGDTIDHWRIDYVDLATYDDPDVSSDGRAEYHFEYASDGTVEPADSVLLSRRCPHTESEYSATVRVALLEAIQMPEDLRYEMEYDLGNQVSCSQLDYDDSGSASGNITQLRLPTGATIEYAYRQRVYPSQAGVEFTPIEGWAVEAMYLARVPGIKSRIVKDSAGTVLFDTEYEHLRHVEAGSTLEQAQKRIVRHRNGQSIVNEVHHYFSTCVVSGCASREYGLPLTRVGMPASGPFLSTETYVPNAAGQLVLGRSSYVIYEGDWDLTSASHFDVDGNDLNRRVKYTKTVYEDDTFTDVASSLFDGVGQYRQTVMDSTVAAGNNLRTTFTNFNPARGTFNVAPNGSYFGTFSMPAVDAKWNFGMYDAQRTTRNGVTSTVSACFDGTTGFLKGRRIYAEFGASPQLRGRDLLAIFTPDGAGNVSVEQYLGGDEGVEASTSVTCPSSSTSDNYQVKHHYESGVRKASYFIGPSGSPFSHFILDADIDANTGLVKSRREASTVGTDGDTNGDGLKTDFKYDELGRLVLETPSTTANRGARRRIEFSTSATKVEVFEENATGSEVLRKRTLDLDGLGRVRKETRTIAGGASATAFRTWELDGVGRLTAASAWGIKSRR